MLSSSAFRLSPAIQSRFYPFIELSTDTFLKVPWALAKGPSLLLVPLPEAVGDQGWASSCAYYHGFKYHFYFKKRQGVVEQACEFYIWELEMGSEARLSDRKMSAGCMGSYLKNKTTKPQPNPYKFKNISPMPISIHTVLTSAETLWSSHT